MDSINVRNDVVCKKIADIGRTIVQHIWRLLDMDWEVVVKHLYREANKFSRQQINQELVHMTKFVLH